MARGNCRVALLLLYVLPAAAAATAAAAAAVPGVHCVGEDRWLEGASEGCFLCGGARAEASAAAVDGLHLQHGRGWIPAVANRSLRLTLEVQHWCRGGRGDRDWVRTWSGSTLLRPLLLSWRLDRDSCSGSCRKPGSVTLLLPLLLLLLLPCMHHFLSPFTLTLIHAATSNAAEAAAAPELAASGQPITELGKPHLSGCGEGARSVSQDGTVTLFAAAPQPEA